MKIFLNEKEVIELAYDALDMNCPNPDKVHDIALKMDMIYNEDLDMYEDVEEVSRRFLIQRLTSNEKAVYEDKMLVRPKTPRRVKFTSTTQKLTSDNEEKEYILEQLTEHGIIGTYMSSKEEKEPVKETQEVLINELLIMYLESKKGRFDTAREIKKHFTIKRR